MFYNGNELSVWINVHRECMDQVRECLGRVRLNLPSAIVKVCANGIERPDVAYFCDLYDLNYGESDNYFGKGNAPLWHQRSMKWFLKCGRIYNIKLDMDAMVDRTPVMFPNADYFGSVDNSPSYQFIQGGCEGLSLSMVQRIVDAGYVGKDSPYFNHEYFCLPQFKFCEDWALGHMCKSLGVLPTQWSECLSRWKQPVLSHNGYAIAHPRYYGEGKYGYPPCPLTEYSR